MSSISPSRQPPGPAAPAGGVSPGALGRAPARSWPVSDRGGRLGRGRQRGLPAGPAALGFPAGGGWWWPMPSTICGTRLRPTGSSCRLWQVVWGCDQPAARGRRGTGGEGLEAGPAGPGTPFWPKSPTKSGPAGAGRPHRRRPGRDDPPSDPAGHRPGRPGRDAAGRALTRGFAGAAAAACATGDGAAILERWQGWREDVTNADTAGPEVPPAGVLPGCRRALSAACEAMVRLAGRRRGGDMHGKPPATCSTVRRRQPNGAVVLRSRDFAGLGEPCWLRCSPLCGGGRAGPDGT